MGGKVRGASHFPDLPVDKTKLTLEVCLISWEVLITISASILSALRLREWKQKSLLIARKSWSVKVDQDFLASTASAVQNILFTSLSEGSK